MKRKSKPISSPSAQSGFTIIESLVAIILVSVLMVAIAPVVALSVATRIQARRVEQATQAARTYIDSVRSGQITPPKARRSLVEAVDDPNTPGTKKFEPNRQVLAQFPVPPANPLNCKPNPLNYPYCQDTIQLSLYCVDLDGDNSNDPNDPKSGCTSNSSKDLIVQAFRSATPPIANDDGSQGYLLGVRVYRASAFDSSGTLKKMSDVEQKTAARSELNRTYAGGGGNRYAPLVEMTTEVKGTSSNDYKALCDRLGGC